MRPENLTLKVKLQLPEIFEQMFGLQLLHNVSNFAFKPEKFRAKPKKNLTIFVKFLEKII